jgi:hypothetical protein
MPPKLLNSALLDFAGWNVTSSNGEFPPELLHLSDTHNPSQLQLQGRRLCLIFVGANWAIYTFSGILSGKGEVGCSPRLKRYQPYHGERPMLRSASSFSQSTCLGS